MCQTTLRLKGLGPKSTQTPQKTNPRHIGSPTPPPHSKKKKKKKKMARDPSTSASEHLLGFPGLTVSLTPLPFLVIERFISLFVRHSQCSFARCRAKQTKITMATDTRKFSLVVMRAFNNVEHSGQTNATLLSTPETKRYVARC